MSAPDPAGMRDAAMLCLGTAAERDEAYERIIGGREAAAAIDFGVMRRTAERALKQAVPVMLSPGELLALVEMAEGDIRG